MPHLRSPAATAASEMKPYAETIPGTDVKFEMVPIPGGKFMMGSPAEEAKRSEDEGPQHPVKIAPFWMGKYEVTWDEYDQFAFSLDLKKKKREGVDLGNQPEAEKKADAVTRPTPPYADETFGFGRKGQPVICITHHAAMEYCRWLSAKTGKALPPADRGRVGVRLPRRDEDAPTSSATTPAELGDYAWYVENAEKPQPDRQEEAQPLGPLRHPRQRRRVVPGPLRARRLQVRSPAEQPGRRPGRPARRQGILLRRPRRLLGRRRRPAPQRRPPRPRTPNGASRTRSAPRASGGTPTPPSSASASSARSSEQENLKGLKSLVVKGKTTR